jgi:hypothetical protein
MATADVSPLNRRLAQQLLDVARTNTPSPYARKMIGIAN